jgi:amino acid transporter
MGKLQTVFVVMNFILIFATIIALPIGRASQRNDAHFIFANVENLTGWPKGWAFMLAWLSPIWTIGGFDSCVHMSEEAANATRAVPYGILMSIGSCWLFGWILLIVIAACMSPDLDSILGSKFGQPMAQIYYDALGKSGAIGLMTLLFVVQFLMGLSILVAVSVRIPMGNRVTRTTWLPRGVSYGSGCPLFCIPSCLRHVLTLLPITFSAKAGPSHATERYRSLASFALSV